LTKNNYLCFKYVCKQIKYIINKNHQNYILTTENIQKKIDSLLKKIQEKTGVSDKELNELKNILDLADFSEGHD